jgi:hypothetical protein
MVFGHLAPPHFPERNKRLQTVLNRLILFKGLKEPMAFSIFLGEDDLRRMPTPLRETLLRWYFDERQPTPSADLHKAQSAIEAVPLPARKIDLDSFVDGSRRVTFAELVKIGFLKPGDEIYCKSLKRQQRAGSEVFIKEAKVAANGTVDFLGRTFSNPSKLAVAMVNANGGEAKALNGYDYLFVQSAVGPLPLEELRRRLIDGTHEEKCAVATLMDETTAFGSKSEALDWVRENGFPMAASRGTP